MKKTICVVMVLCLTCTLFAGVTVKLGGAFNFVTGGTRDLELKVFNDGTEIKELAKEYKKDAIYKMHGFGFDLSGDFDVSQNLAVWADFNMVFGNFFRFKSDAAFGNVIDLIIKDGDYYSLGKAYDAFEKNDVKDLYKRFNIASFGAGVAYKLALDPLDVKLGGGLYLDRALGKVGAKFDNRDTYFQTKAVNFGIALYAGATYKINKNFGVGLTVMPHVGLFDSFKYTFYIKADPGDKVEDVVSAKGFKLSFAMPIVLGVSYSF